MSGIVRPIYRVAIITSECNGWPSQSRTIMARRPEHSNTIEIIINKIIMVGNQVSGFTGTWRVAVTNFGR